jgi:signal transduction histidine kinase
MEATDIRDGIRNTLAMLRHKLKHKNIRIHKEFDPELPPLQAFVGELNQVWTNLIGNAIDAMEKDGNLTLRTFREDEQICVEVIDDGHGIPADIQEEIFDQSLTTKSIAEGTGMGLEITRQIVDRHDGSITLESIPGRTVFRVCLPISSS